MVYQGQEQEGYSECGEKEKTERKKRKGVRRAIRYDGM
jgi:hypothetical protein